MTKKQKSVRMQLREMKVGDVIVFPLDKVTSIRSALYQPQKVDTKIFIS